MVFSDILHGFSLSSSAQKEDIWATLPDGLTLEMVLENQAPSPFSLKDFSEYLKSTYCHENLLFFQAVMDYKDQCITYFGFNDKDATVLLLDGLTTFDFSAYNKYLLSAREEIWFSILVEKFDLILKDFILSDAPHEINIPYEVRHQLLQSHQTQQLYHPALLYPACSAVVELMRISAFIPFATDPNRHYCPMKKKSALKKQKSSPSFINTSTCNNDLPPLLTPPIDQGFFKKLFRMRSTTHDVQRSTWRQINIPDLSPFKSISTTLVPSSYSSTITTTTSNNSTTSTSSSNTIFKP